MMMKVGIFNNNSYDGIHSSDTERTWIKNKKNAHVSGRRRKCPQNMNFPFNLGKIGALHQGENLELPIYRDQVCTW